MQAPASPPTEDAPSSAAKPVVARPPKKRARNPFVVLGAIATVTLLGIGAFALSVMGKESTDDAEVEADVVPVAVRTGGQVLSVLVADNQEVKTGDVLLELDSADHELRLQQAQAQLETAQAQLAAAESKELVATAAAKGGLHSAKAMVSSSSLGVSSADAQIAAARAGLERAKADVHKAEVDLVRAKDLRAANAIPEQRLEHAQVAFDSAHAALTQAEAQLAAAEDAKQVAQSRVAEAEGRLNQSTPVDAQIAAAHAATDLARAQVKAADAAVKLAQLQVSYTKVTAPRDGRVSQLSAHVGQLLRPGQPVAQLVPIDTYIIANFKETQVGHMHKGERAKIDVDAYPGVDLEGTVDSLSAGTGARFSLLPPDNASGNFVKVVQRIPVRIAWKSLPKDLQLRAGLSADVTVYVNE